MRVKLDENLPAEVEHLFAAAGHDVETVVHQGMGGADDEKLSSVVREERRTLVTLDRGFGDIRLHPPAAYAGLIILRLARQDPDFLAPVCIRLLEALSSENVDGQLWIVEESGIRRRAGDESDQA